MKPNILIVDDEAGVCDLLKSVIMDSVHSVDVLTCHNVDRALELAHQHQPDVIISDVLMPGKSGLDFLRIIREQGNSTPFLMMSGYGDTDLIRKAWRLGAFHFLSKPIETESLLNLLAECLRLASENATSERQEKTAPQPPGISILLEKSVFEIAKRSASHDGQSTTTWISNLILKSGKN